MKIDKLEIRLAFFEQPDPDGAPPRAFTHVLQLNRRGWADRPSPTNLGVVCLLARAVKGLAERPEETAPHLREAAEALFFNLYDRQRASPNVEPSESEHDRYEALLTVLSIAQTCYRDLPHAGSCVQSITPGSGPCTCPVARLRDAIDRLLFTSGPNRKPFQAQLGSQVMRDFRRMRELIQQVIDEGHS